MLIIAVTIGIYSIYLDSKVRNKFEGQRWQVPIQVFGKIDQLQLNAPININGITETLGANGYKKVTTVTQAGHYAATKNRLIIYRRKFDFGAGIEPTAKILIDVKNNKITQLTLDNRPVKQVTLEPILIDRILPESKEDRILISLENVPEQLLDTLLLVEDRDYYFHAGISPVGILRALYKNFRAGRTVQGGSTLTQQLVKNMFLTRDKTLWRKVNEAIMALILEYRYSKDQLLEAYLNEVYLGQHYANGIYGFGLAAKFYFGKSIEQLNIEQMAMLIGQVKGPSYYDPWRYPERAKNRRDLILKLMFQQHYLSQVDFEYAIESPLSIRKHRRLQKQNYPAYLQLVKQELNQHLLDVQQQSGIRVFTGFSHFSQQNLQQTVSNLLPSLEKKYQQSDLQAAMLVTDIPSGEIRALVGDRKSGYAGFNRALHAQRPIGSLIKPAVYLAALERYEQFNLASILKDKPIVLTSDAGKEWRPKNHDGKFRQQVSLNDGLVYSLNVPTVNLGMKLGLNKVIDAIGLQGYTKDITARPSLLLGAINMSPYEINQLYLPVAAKGMYQKSHAITKILSSQSEVLWQYKNQMEQRFSTQASFLIDHALNQVTKKGTAKSLTWRLKNKRLAGKTGTSNDLRDSWFIGYDAKHLVTTWVGKDDNKTTKLTGSSGALVLFADFMKKQGVVNKPIKTPDGIELALFETKSGHAVTANCSDTIEYPAIKAGIKIKADCLPEVEKEVSWFDRLFGG
ncbi:MAG: penicillin-binding protein 1B [Alteromonadaceae bacterium]|nr:penicillin-binding protein 1B [Alteromonadaceae bacterium]